MAVRRSGWLLIGIVALGVVGYKVQRKLPPYQMGFHEAAVEASSADPNTAGPHVGSCPVFPPDNIWNTPVDKLDKHPKSDAYIQSIGPQQHMHPDFASAFKYGIPFTEAPAGTRAVPVDFENKDESDPGPYRIPADAPVEGAGAEGDAHVLVIDAQNCTLYELYGAHKDGAGWKAGSGIAVDLKSDALRKAGRTSADAAGLPIFPGLVRYDEIEAGEIRHALRFTVPHTQGSYVWPARHSSGRPDANLPPMGMRFRLKPDFDISTYSKTNRIILRALKRYGMFLSDNGGTLYLSGVPDKRWEDDDLRKLRNVTMDAFEAVDEADLELKPNSGQVDPKFMK